MANEKCVCDTCKHKEDWFVCDACIHEASLKDKYEALSNADRIRAMEDEELAKYLSSLIRDMKNGIPYSDDEDRWFNWLQEPDSIGERKEDA